MSEKDKVENFYDEFNLKSRAARRNLRHYTLIHEIIKVGLNKRSKVLEIGCGSGQISIPLAKFVSKGSYTGMDISPASIAFLNKHFKNKSNVNFFSSDIADFKIDTQFDFIIMADVLEHIPIENHERTFEFLSKVTLPNSRIFINIPTRGLINWQSKNTPNELQVIDQALPTGHIVTLAEKNGFVSEFSKKHKLFHDSNDYEMFLFIKDAQKEVDFVKRNTNSIIINKLKKRIRVFFRTCY